MPDLQETKDRAREGEQRHSDEDDSAGDGHQDRRGRDAGDQGSGERRAGAEGDKKNAERPRRSRRLFIILGIALVVAVIAGVWYWLSTADLVSTDDAYTDGYTVTVAPQVSGQVIKLAVTDNQFVHAGDVLIQIDPRNYADSRDEQQGNLVAMRGQLDSARLATEVAQKNFPAQLAQAQAQLSQAKANLFKAEADARRQHGVAKQATTQEAIDNADAALRQAQAQVEQAQAQVQAAEPVKPNIGETSARVDQLAGQLKQAEAQLAQADLNLEWTTVRAPQDGWVTQRGVDAGNYVQPGQTIMTLVAPNPWVTANFKENQLARMRPGQRVTINVDAYPDMKLTGHVDSIQLGSGSKFSAFPAENATGNYVKIVQRVPVKIVIDDGLNGFPLPLGISVGPTVHLK